MMEEIRTVRRELVGGKIRHSAPRDGADSEMVVSRLEDLHGALVLLLITDY